MFESFVAGMLLAAFVLLIVFGLLDALTGRHRPTVTASALRGGFAIGLAVCGVITLISWAVGYEDWFRLGLDDGMFLAVVAYLSAVYLTRRLARRKMRRVASARTFSRHDVHLPDDGAIRVRPTTAQEIADFRRRYNGSAITPPMSFAETRPYAGGK